MRGGPAGAAAGIKHARFQFISHHNRDTTLHWPGVVAVIVARHIIFRFDLLPWKFPLTSMEVSTEANLLPWSRWKMIYFHRQFMEVGGRIFTSMEVSESFHGNTWTFLLSVEMEIHGRFQCRWK